MLFVVAMLRWEEGRGAAGRPLRGFNAEATAATAETAAAAAAELEAAAEKLFAAEGLKLSAAVRCATR